MPRRRAVAGDGPATPKPVAPAAPKAPAFDTVEATDTGYYGDQLRIFGARFQVPHGAKSRWWKTVS